MIAKPLTRCFHLRHNVARLIGRDVWGATSFHERDAEDFLCVADAVIALVREAGEGREVKRIHALLLADWPYCILGDPDGSDHVARLLSLGLVEKCEVVTPCGGPECSCEPGDMCAVITPLGRAALAQQEEQA